MSDLGDYAENKLLDALFNASTTGGGLPTADVWVKLHTGAPGESGASAASAETTRKQQSFAAAASGSAASNAQIDWASWSAGTETITHVSFWDASTVGNHLGNAALSASKTVNNGDTLSFASGAITFALA